MAAHLHDKAFFKKILAESKDYSSDIAVGFPYFCMKIFWDSLSHDEICDALDGLKTNDESVDGFFVDHENKEINIVQCKSVVSFKNKNRSAKKEWFSYLSEVPEKLRDHKYIDEHKNPRLKEIAEDYIKFREKDNYQVKLRMFHLGTCEDQVKNHYVNRIEYYGWSEIKDEFEEYSSKLEKTEPSSIKIELEHEKLEPKLNSRHRTFVSIISGSEIIRLREQFRYKLFDKNLRFGLGKNKINNEISECAKSWPQNFYFYNNGLTITSGGFKFKEASNSLRIDSPQIINGAQTVNSIFSAYKQELNKQRRRYPYDDAEKAVMEKFKEIQVLFRVIQDSERTESSASDFERNVIRYNNSQNSIHQTDFYANADEQIKLQRHFAKFGYFYEIKRGERKYLEEQKEEHLLLKMKKADFSHWGDKISIDKIASVWMAYKVDPTLGKVQKANIFGSDYSKGYQLIFDPEKINENYAKEMILAFNLFDLIDQQTKIYGNTISDGQILLKLSEYQTEDLKSLQNIQRIIQSNFVLPKVFKKKIETHESLIESKDNLLTCLQEYYYFSMARYLSLAIFRQIIEQCNYRETLVDDTYCRFANKDYLKKIVEQWLKIVVDELIRKEYEEYKSSIGNSVKSFYNRSGTWENVQRDFRMLEFKLDKEFTEIFELPY